MKKKKKKVLVIDDEDFIRDLVKEFLGLSNVQCEEADSSETALELVSQHDFHLILLDRNLGNFKAEDFITRIKEVNNDIPVVILTGDPRCDTKYLNRIGADGIIFKPFQVAEFTESVSKFLEI